MRKDVFRKGIVLGIIFLFFGAGIVPSVIGDNPVFGKTIYVYNDNTEGPWDGSPEHPYQHIQDGIDAASGGDTVFVFNGTYYENVVVDKSILLIGEDRNNTIIDGSGAGIVVAVSDNGVNISNFTIQNGMQGIDSNYGLDVYQNLVRDNEYGMLLSSIHEPSSSNIMYNIVTDNEIGIALYDGVDFGIKQNIISDNSDIGIFINHDSTNNIIEFNNITYNHKGVHLQYDSVNNVFMANNFIQNDEQTRVENCLINSWIRNYWDDWIGLKIPLLQRWLPKVIWGRYYLVPVPNFDWFPSEEPYKEPCP